MARLLGVTRQAFYTWIDAGKLKAHRDGAKKRILGTDLERPRAAWATERSKG